MSHPTCLWHLRVVLRYSTTSSTLVGTMGVKTFMNSQIVIFMAQKLETLESFSIEKIRWTLQFKFALQRPFKIAVHLVSMSFKQRISILGTKVESTKASAAWNFTPKIISTDQNCFLLNRKSVISSIFAQKCQYYYTLSDQSNFLSDW